ncbi:cytidylyltransferase domain-containing protein [Cohnella nanjingensis]|uniref:Glycosyltransferase family protein n=1 Tax=Cohnella nanjingensis TaxID=1387779 RepID=A0A7X0RSK5_9BACL|nr:glycosyltransferase family protein [Cohnella nanjingensis]MBB6671701.1 glycosyltransferase family protein [Cohnella nanjingensis]
MQIVAVIQARTGSSRLPGKVMRTLDGIPVVRLMVMRLSRSRRLSQIVVATGDTAADDAFAASLAKEGIEVFRGSEHDVLERYYQAARKFRADVVVRVTGDCPFIDPEIVDRVIDRYLEAQPGVRYASNLNPPTYPDGLDTEVFAFEALEQAWREARWSSEREHVTPFIRSRPERFPQANVTSDGDYAGYRWTLDEERDYRFLQALSEKARAAGWPAADATFAQLLHLMERHEDLRGINGGIGRNEGEAKSLREDRRLGEANG